MLFKKLEQVTMITKIVKTFRDYKLRIGGLSFDFLKYDRAPVELESEF